MGGLRVKTLHCVAPSQAVLIRAPLKQYDDGRSFEWIMPFLCIGGPAGTRAAKDHRCHALQGWWLKRFRGHGENRDVERVWYTKQEGMAWVETACVVQVGVWGTTGKWRGSKQWGMKKTEHRKATATAKQQYEAGVKGGQEVSVNRGESTQGTKRAAPNRRLPRAKRQSTATR